MDLHPSDDASSDDPSHDDRAVAAGTLPPGAVAARSRRHLLGAGVGGVVGMLSPAFVGLARAGTDDTTSDTGAGNPTGGTTGDSTGDDSGGRGESTPSGTGDGTGSGTVDDATPGTAQDRGSDTTAAGTTTTEVPNHPTEDDLPLLRFAQTAELAARDLYDAALGSGAFDDDEVQTAVITAIREAHEAYAQSLSGIIGRTAPGTASDAVLGEQIDAFSGGSAKEIVAAGRDLENTLAATHISLLAELAAADGAALVASILVVEGRHATVLAQMAGLETLEDLIVNEADALEPPE